MERDTWSARAIRFRELHQGPGILVLPNAWDAASARIFETAGFQAIGTTSAGVSFALGFPDGNRASRAPVLGAVKRIASAVSAPVTADMVSGYGESMDEVVETAKVVVAAGAVGMNIEDASGDGALFDRALQVEKIQAIRRACDSAGTALVINARTDVYLGQIGEPESRFQHAVERANAYRKAGADCLFVPGVRDAETIRRLTHAIDGPVNILAVAGAPPVAVLESLGVRRVSVGSGPMRATLALTARIALELIAQGTYGSFADAIPYPEANRLFEEN
ncbi:MAG: phosphonomutase -like protein [Bryobacterales bacterium]|nr:phosphonomutase -like protein [Bryobacterales bacterium]